MIGLVLVHIIISTLILIFILMILAIVSTLIIVITIVALIIFMTPLHHLRMFRNISVLNKRSNHQSTF